MPHAIGSYITDSDLKDGTVLIWYLPTLVPTWTVTNCGTSLNPHRRHHSVVVERLHRISNSLVLIPIPRASSNSPPPRVTRKAVPGEPNASRTRPWLAFLDLRDPRFTDKTTNGFIACPL